MISDFAHERIEQEIVRLGKSDGVMAMALKLYSENYKTLKSRNAALTPRQLEETLLLPTSLSGLLEQSEQVFRSQADKATRGARTRLWFLSAAGNILLNIIGNFAFIILSLGIYLVAQDTARTLFQSFGFEVKYIKHDETPAVPKVPQAETKG